MQQLTPAQAVTVLDRFIAGAKNPECTTNDFLVVASAVAVLREAHPDVPPVEVEKVEEVKPAAPNRQQRRAATKK